MNSGVPDEQAVDLTSDLPVSCLSSQNTKLYVSSLKDQSAFTPSHKGKIIQVSV